MNYILTPRNIVSSALALSLWGFVFAFLLVLGGGNNVSAYTCEYSNNGDGKFTTGSNYTGDLIYLNGNCVVYKPDEKGPLAKTDTVTGKKTCDDPLQVVHSDNYCWKYKPEYTNLKPTYDDGTVVPEQTWTELCGQNRHGQVFDGPLSYNSSLHRCENTSGIIDGCTFQDNNDLQNNLIEGACTTLDDNENGHVLKDDYTDPTETKVRECEAAGAQMNGKTHECEWNQSNCPKKSGGQGVWVNNQCKAYSDFNTEEECKKVPDSEWWQDPNDKSHWECVRKGTEGNSNKDPDADCPKKVNGVCQSINASTKRCGEANVNVLGCGEEGGATALQNVLRIFVIVLTFGVGIAALGGLAYSAVRYAGASDNQSNVAEARERIRNIVIGLLLYGFLLAIANWLIPGGIL